MEPIFHPGVNPKPAFALGHLIGVVNRGQIDAPGVYIEMLPEITTAHGRTFEVPTRESASPRRIPFLKATHVGIGKFPDGKIRGVPFALDLLDPLGTGLAFQIETCQFGVAGTAGDIEIDSILDPVEIPPLLELDPELDLLGNVLRGLGIVLGLDAVHRLTILSPELGVTTRDFLGGLALALGRHFHLVLALVGVGNQMTHVGDIDHVGDREPLADKKASQQIGEELRANVPDMHGAVDRGPAGVDSHLPVL